MHNYKVVFAPILEGEFVLFLFIFNRKYQQHLIFSIARLKPPTSISLSYSSLFWNQNSRTKEVCNDFDCESDNENRAFQSRKRSSDQITSCARLGGSKCNSPIHPHQDIVKCIEKLQSGHQDDALPKNGHYELINIGKASSESSLKLNSTATPKFANKNTAQWHPSCEKNNELKPPTQTASMTNVNINNNIDSSIANQQLGSSNLCILRSRTHTKSLSTRISSLKRESKTTRTLSIVMFRWSSRFTYSYKLMTLLNGNSFPFSSLSFSFVPPVEMATKNSFIACWLPFFIHYLMVSFLDPVSHTKKFFFR